VLQAHIKRQVEEAQRRKVELEKSIKEMKQKLVKERSFQLFMEQDFYFDGATGRKIKEPIAHVYQDKQKLKALVHKLRENGTRDRAPSDYKELRSLLESFHWFRENMYDMEFNATDAAELFKYVKVKFYKPRETVFQPGYSDRSLYFILRGRVSVGMQGAKDTSDDFTKIFALTKAESKLKKASLD
jgi:hypothetical protein